MADTKLADIIVPEVFTGATLQPSIFRSRLIGSGAIALSPQLNAFLSGGGDTVNMKFFNDIGHTESDLPSETIDTTINNITQGKQVATRLFREKAWGSNSFASIFSGDDPMAAIQTRVVGYWAQDYDKTAFKILEGLRLDNVANDSSDLQIGDGLSSFDDDMVIDAQGLLGENGVIGANDQPEGEFKLMVVHPKIYTALRKADLIVEIPASAQTRAMAFYNTMEVVVDRNAPEPVGGKFVTYLLKAGALQFGQSSSGYVPTEVDRLAEIGGGTDRLFTRRVYSIHPNGFSFVGTPAADAGATNTELALATSWDRVWEQENSGWAAIYSTV